MDIIFPYYLVLHACYTEDKRKKIFPWQRVLFSCLYKTVKKRKEKKKREYILENQIAVYSGHTYPQNLIISSASYSEKYLIAEPAFDSC